jgi:hypothetical protein
MKQIIWDMFAVIGIACMAVSVAFAILSMLICGSYQRKKK